MTLCDLMSRNKKQVNSLSPKLNLSPSKFLAKLKYMLNVDKTNEVQTNYFFVNIKNFTTTLCNEASRDINHIKELVPELPTNLKNSLKKCEYLMDNLHMAGNLVRQMIHIVSLIAK